MDLGSVSAQIAKLEQAKLDAFNAFNNTDAQLRVMKTAQQMYYSMANDTTLQAFIGDILSRHGVGQDVIQSIWVDALAGTNSGYGAIATPSDAPTPAIATGTTSNTTGTDTTSTTSNTTGTDTTGTDTTNTTTTNS